MTKDENVRLEVATKGYGLDQLMDDESELVRSQAKSMMVKKKGENNALTTDESVARENIGKGKYNHVSHQKTNKSKESFSNRISKIKDINKYENGKILINNIFENYCPGFLCVNNGFFNINKNGDFEQDWVDGKEEAENYLSDMLGEKVEIQTENKLYDYKYRDHTHWIKSVKIGEKVIKLETPKDVENFINKYNLTPDLSCTGPSERDPDSVMNLIYGDNAEMKEGWEGLDLSEDMYTFYYKTMDKNPFSLEIFNNEKSWKEEKECFEDYIKDYMDEDDYEDY